MEVKERIGNDTFQIIYLRGALAITAVMHDHYNESGLLLKKVGKVWKVMDAFVDRYKIDHGSVSLVGSNELGILLKYEYSGVFASGVLFAEDSYVLISDTSFIGQVVFFISESSNIGSDQCPESDDENCTCYTRRGDLKINLDKNLNAYVYSYDYTSDLISCSRKTIKSEKVKQVWYMNQDTVFLAKGPEILEYGTVFKGDYNLSEEEIKKRLRK